MNDLIMRLAEEASKQSPDGYPVSIPYSEAFVKKFAGLLVKHTLDLVEKESEKAPEKWTCKDGAHIWWKIADEFDVECHYGAMDQFLNGAE